MLEAGVIRSSEQLNGGVHLIIEAAVREAEELSLVGSEPRCFCRKPYLALLKLDGLLLGALDLTLLRGNVDEPFLSIELFDFLDQADPARLVLDDYQIRLPGLLESVNLFAQVRKGGSATPDVEQVKSIGTFGPGSADAPGAVLIGLIGGIPALDDRLVL